MYPLPSVVCGVDRSPPAAAAARLAARLSRRLGLRLVLVSVAEAHGRRAGAGDEALQVLEEVSWTQDLVGAELRPESGPIAESLLAVAAEEAAYALVVGAGQRRALTHLFRESLTRTLAREASCAVIVAPADR